tara:strand:+ start:275 stop:553 length:279 start_codon:yes stop_codon:yes gene_type:complete
MSNGTSWVILNRSINTFKGAVEPSGHKGFLKNLKPKAQAIANDRAGLATPPLDAESADSTICPMVVSRWSSTGGLKMTAIVVSMAVFLRAGR